MSAILAVQAEAPAIQKTKLNPAFKSRYITLDTLMDSIMPVLNKHGLVWLTVPSYTDNMDATLAYRLIHVETGEEIGGEMPLMLSKQDPQGQGSAITYARRYSLMAVLGLVAEEDDDGARASKPAWKPQPGRVADTAKLMPPDARTALYDHIVENDKEDEIPLLLAAVGASEFDLLTIDQGKQIWRRAAA